MNRLQSLGKAIMFPVACLPLCGILMGLGYLLCPASMQGGSITGFIPAVGLYLVKAGGALIDQIPLLFAVGVGVGLAKDRDGMAGLSALVTWLMITTLLKPDNVIQFFPSLTENASLAFGKIENPFIGILSGVIGAFCYNRFRNTKLPEWLAFFSGKRSTVIVSGLAAICTSVLLLVAWPLLFGGLVRLGMWIAGLGSFGAGLYLFLNRLLIPFGLHHALNNVFWFDTIGLGDLTHFWAGHTSADVTWSLGIYMSGFFPCMMFGVPAAALAMIHSAPKARRSAAAGILASGALCSFICGITEPFEFAFMFAAPALYVVYSLLYGIFGWLCAVTGFRAGFAFSGGATDLLFSASLPAAQKTWLIVPLGAAAFLSFYLVFRLMITRLDLATPGREKESEAFANSAEIPGEHKKAQHPGASKSNFAQMAAVILRGLGGADNVLSVDSCITRLRLEIKDMQKVSDSVIRSSGAAGVIRPGKNALQIVIGTTVEFVADELKKLCESQSRPGSSQTQEDLIFEKGGNEEGILSPAKGEVVPMEEIPDPVFSGGVMGECVGITPEYGEIYAPISGKISTVAGTRHAISISGCDEEILVHVGIDTVRLDGEGFEVLVKEGDDVCQGQLIMKADLDLIRSRGFNPMIIVARVQ